jgi:hypothetical protein
MGCNRRRGRPCRLLGVRWVPVSSSLSAVSRWITPPPSCGWSGSRRTDRRGPPVPARYCGLRIRSVFTDEPTCRCLWVALDDLGGALLTVMWTWPFLAPEQGMGPAPLSVISGASVALRRAPWG